MKSSSVERDEFSVVTLESDFEPLCDGDTTRHRSLADLRLLGCRFVNGVEVGGASGGDVDS